MTGANCTFANLGFIAFPLIRIPSTDNFSKTCDFSYFLPNLANTEARGRDRRTGQAAVTNLCQTGN